jgi:hypothetical protein
MSTYHTRRVDQLIFAGFVVLHIVASGCYTIVKPLPVSEREQRNRSVFQRELTVDDRLIAAWMNTELLMDYGNRVKTVKFTGSGAVYFNINKEVTGKNFDAGTYRIFGDSLLIYFDNKYFIEQYRYKINSNTLILERLRKAGNESYSLVENNSASYSRKEE